MTKFKLKPYKVRVKGNKRWVNVMASNREAAVWKFTQVTRRKR